MSVRRVGVVILCEDTQQECFIRRFLIGMGWNKRCFRINKSPSATGSAEQYVREQFPIELQAYRMRKNKAASSLIAMIDADVNDIDSRIDEFSDECDKKNIPFRDDREAAAIAVPKRNIETWIGYLDGKSVDEFEEYLKLPNERDCRQAVRKLVDMCRTTGLPDNAPSSLKHACDEYNNRIKPLIRQV